MKIFLTGSTGQVGSAIKNRLNQLKQHKVLSLEKNECDLSRTDSLKRNIDKQKPDLIINAAAYTKVDQAEDDIDLAYLINSKAVRILSESAKDLDIKLIHISTDYVFDGSKNGKYNENYTIKNLNTNVSYYLRGEEFQNQITDFLNKIDTNRLDYFNTEDAAACDAIISRIYNYKI